MVQPNNETDFDEIKHADGSCQKWEGIFHKVDGAEDNPVHHPLCGITVDALASFQRLEGHVSRVQKANKVGCEFHSARDDHQKGDEGAGPGKEKYLGVTGLVLQFLEFFCNERKRRKTKSEKQTKVILSATDSRV